MNAFVLNCNKYKKHRSVEVKSKIIVFKIEIFKKFSKIWKTTKFKRTMKIRSKKFKNFF